MMWNDTTIELVIENDSDQSTVIQSFLLSQEDLSNGERLNSSINRSGNRYTIVFSQKHYSDHEEIIILSRELAKAQPHQSFTLSAHSWNEGSGGNYTEKVFVTYRYGTFSSKFYSNSEIYIIERESEDPPEPRLVEAAISQLFPKTDFIEDITDLIEREHFTDTSIIGENKFVIENGKLSAYYGPGEGDLLIPDGITSIRDSIWNAGIFGKLAITSVIIPEGVTHIGSYAFRECKNLRYVSIPDSVISIGDGAFYECENLERVTIPEGVTNIGVNTFYRCEKLVSLAIPESVSSIGRYAFFGCKELSSIIIPDGISTIDNSTFLGCSNLMSVKLPESVTTIKERAFGGCTNLRELNIPQNVSCIEGAFRACRSLRGISMPEAVMESILNMSPDKYGKVVLDGGIWSVMDPAQQSYLFQKKQGKAITPLYKKCLEDDQITILGMEFLKTLQNQISAKECSAIATFITLFYSKLSIDVLRALQRTTTSKNWQESSGTNREQFRNKTFF